MLIFTRRKVHGGFQIKHVHHRRYVTRLSSLSPRQGTSTTSCHHFKICRAIRRPAVFWLVKLYASFIPSSFVREFSVYLLSSELLSVLYPYNLLINYPSFNHASLCQCLKAYLSLFSVSPTWSSYYQVGQILLPLVVPYTSIAPSEFYPFLFIAPCLLMRLILLYTLVT